MEPVGLAIGVLGIAGLFKSCIDNFDIVVKAREFGTDFDLLCTQLSLQRIRLVLWGETLGLTPESSTPFNPLLNRKDIAPAIESALCHLQLLLQKADIVTDRYEIQGEGADDQAVVDLRSRQSAGLNIFKERFDLLKARLRRNQKEKTAWTVTRWAVHDLGKFKDFIANIRELMDGLEDITSTLGVLQQQQALLATEIESISDTQSLRLLQQATSTDGASASFRLVSETASVRLSLLDDSVPAGVLRSTKTSYYTAFSHFGQTSIQRSVIFEDSEPEHPPAVETCPMEVVVSGLAISNDPIPETSEQQPVRRNRQLFRRVIQRVEALPFLPSFFTKLQTVPSRSARISELPIRSADSLKEPSQMAITKASVAVTKSLEPAEPIPVSGESSTPATQPIPVLERSRTMPAYTQTEDLEDLPQNQRLMAELVKGSSAPLPSLSFKTGSSGYGDALAWIHKRNDETHSRHSFRLLLHANNDKDTSAARRAFLELRSLRRAAVPFVTASLMENRLDRLIASIEGPPDTPYEGGVFWILVKLPPQPAEPPVLRFVTRIYHPNVDCNGNICADYQSWWKDTNLQRYMNGFSPHRREKMSWFSDGSWNPYSLGALLVALCSLLASPNVLDPLVPEIAATYIQDYAKFCEQARQYTQRYAHGIQERPEDSDIERFDQEAGSLLQFSRLDADQTQSGEASGTMASSAHGAINTNLRSSGLSVDSNLSTLAVRERQIQKEEEEEDREKLREIRSVKRMGKKARTIGELNKYHLDKIA